MINQRPEVGLFLFSFFIFLFLYVILGHSQKIVGQIRGVLNFGGTLAWVTSPSWPPPKPTAGSASDHIPLPNTADEDILLSIRLFFAHNLYVCNCSCL